MRVELTGRHVDTTPALRRLVDLKLARLARLLNDSALSAQVVLTRAKHMRRADVTLHARGEKFLHGVGESGTWELSLSQAADKIVQQAQRVKGKWQERKRQGAKRLLQAVDEGPLAERRVPSAKPAVKARMPRILRAMRQPLKAMSISDAAREVELNGDGVVVFRDAETDAISVLYRRANGELTLVETES